MSETLTLKPVETRPEVEVTRHEVTTADVLERAADLLEEFGWCQQHYALTEEGEISLPDQGDAVQFCAAGAAMRSMFDFGLENWTGGHGLVKAAFGGEASRWNDEPGRTKEEVVARLREAARKARSGE